MVAKSQKIEKLAFLDKLFVGILLVVFGGIVLHAPLIVGLGTLFPSADLLIKSWKEILMLLAGLILIVLLYQKKQWRLLKDPIVLVIAGYALLHLLLLLPFWQGLSASIAGLFIDLRYLLFFVLVYTAIRLYPSLRRTFIVTFFVGAFIVAAFALLQVFVLPHDVLKYIGYNNSTIAPYLTVDQNSQYIRINSTLRGPNPLGAYAVIVLTLLFAFWLRAKQVKPQRQNLVISVIVIGSFVALWASYSRSALFAAFATLGVVALAVAGRRLPRKFWIALGIVLVLVAGALIAGQHTNFVSNVLLHDNATTGAAVDSNQGHIESLHDGLVRTMQQPLGAGIGSTGSASLYGSKPLIVENQFLFIAHEVGWLGLALFLYVSFLVLKALWQRRADWLALGVFASGIGMILIGLLLPVWVDDTVAIIWWGLAAVALASVKGKDSDGRKIDKTSKELLDYVDAFIQEHGYGPSYREIMNAIGYKSVSTVAIHIDGLITKGFLRKTDNSARSLEVVTTNAATAAGSKSISPAKEKWLVDEVNSRFVIYGNSPNQMTLDELYVLIGTLKILGLDGAHEAAKAKLSKLR